MLMCITLFFNMHSVLLGWPQYAYDFSNASRISCLQYAQNNKICCRSSYVRSRDLNITNGELRKFCQK